MALWDATHIVVLKAGNYLTMSLPGWSPTWAAWLPFWGLKDRQFGSQWLHWELFQWKLSRVILFWQFCAWPWMSPANSLKSRWKWFHADNTPTPPAMPSGEQQLLYLGSLKLILQSPCTAVLYFAEHNSKVVLGKGTHRPLLWDCCVLKTLALWACDDNNNFSDFCLQDHPSLCWWRVQSLPTLGSAPTVWVLVSLLGFECVPHPNLY